MTVPEEYKKTVKSALNMLAYAENTKKGLIQKLLQKGYSRESVDFTVEYLQSKRLLDEERYLYRLVETLAKTKGYGEKRIRLELYNKGFSDEVIECCLEDAFSLVDFDDICYNLAKKNWCLDKEKCYVKLLRRGHTSERISRSLKRIERELLEN